MIAKRVTKRKPLTKMTAGELAEATAEYDRRPLPDDAGKPMTPAERAEWANSRQGPGRPRKGLGAVNVLISFERGLLDRADAFARSREIGRSALVAEALEAFMAANARSLKNRRAAV